MPTKPCNKHRLFACTECSKRRESVAFERDKLLDKLFSAIKTTPRWHEEHPEEGMLDWAEALTDYIDFCCEQHIRNR